MASFLQKMFKPKTFKPQWQHEDANIRLEAITSELPYEALLTLAKKDSAESVRLKAITQLNSLPDLSSLFSDKNKSIKHLALQQYLQIATGAKGMQQQIDNLNDINIKHTNSTEILLAIASESPDQKMSQAALDLVQDETALFEFIMNSNSAKARVKAAEKITIISMLKEIESKFKGKDKTLHRLAKNNIQQHTTEQARKESKKQATESLLKQAKLLTTQAFSPTFEGQLAHLKQAWKKSEFTETLDNEFIEYIAQCEQIFSAHKEQQEAVNAEQALKQQANLLHEQAFNLAVNTLQEYKEKSVKSFSEVESALNTIETIWLNGQAISKASKQLVSDFENERSIIKNIHAALKSLEDTDQLINKKLTNIDSMLSHKKTINSVLKSLNWPSDLSTPANVLKLEKVQSTIDDSINQIKDNETNNIRSIESKIAEFKIELDNGNLKNADKIQQLIKKELSQVERNKSKHLQIDFQFLSSELDRLKDWKGFAAKPKFIELCENMESLVNSNFEAKDLAKAIQTLQNQWKALGSLGDKKEHNQLWARFKTASDAAYQPCQAFYNQQSNSRAFNLEQRQTICEQLEALFQQQDWDNANWKALQKIVDKAFHEYKKFAPVDRSANTEIQSRFNNATTAIKQKLQGYYQANLDAKQALVDECAALLEAEDISAAINRCKDIQNEWKTIESAGKTEQSLWIKFREQCDAIFERRNQAFQAKRTATSQLIDSAQEIVEQAKLLESCPSKDVLKQLTQFKQDIQALEIPEKIKAAKSHAISAIEVSVKSSIEQASKNQDSQRWINAQDVSTKISYWERDKEGSLEALKHLINETDLPKDATETFLQRLENTTKTEAEALQAHCLDYEIAMGIDSPTTDQQARMAIQIKRLQENMGKQQPSRLQSSSQSQLTWFSFNGQAERYEEYQDRFFEAVKQTN